MQITLFRALQSIKIDDDRASEVVEAVEEFVAVKIKEATAGLEAQLKASTAGLEAQLKAQTWLIGALGSVIAIGVLVSALAPIITKLIH